MEKRDYYEILGVSKSSTTDEIKKAYRKMAIKYHPDKNPGDKASEEKFKEAAEAYEILSDKTKKQKYDQYGHNGDVGGFNGSSGGFGGMNMDDIFKQYGDVFGGHFNTNYGRSNVRKNVGKDLRVKINLNLSEIANGVEKKIKINKDVACSACDGSGAKNKASIVTCKNCNGTGQEMRITNTVFGQMQQITTCSTCNGDGKMIVDKCTTCNGSSLVKKDDVVTIKIPPGVFNGMNLSMERGGNMGAKNGIAGNLIILIEEIIHPLLKRDGINLHYNAPISFPDVVLGTTIEVPSVNDGVRMKIKVEPGTQSGKILRLQGKGLIDINNTNNTGDILVSVNVYTPQHLTDAEKQIIEKLQKNKNFKPN